MSMGCCFHRTLTVPLFLACLFGASVGWGQVELIGVVRIAGDLPDRSSLGGNLETGTPINAFGGLSAIEYTGEKNRYMVLSDRGPGDGAASFPCRFHTVELEVDLVRRVMRFELIDTTFLTRSNGERLLGSLESLRGWDGQGDSPSLDPEGIRFVDRATLAISDEYGPRVGLFSRSGQLERSLPLPERFALSERQPSPWLAGTFTNRGLEGIAITPDRTRLVAAMQGPLVQDGRIENGKCLGLPTRWLVYDLLEGTSVQWVYSLEDESTGVSEVLAIDANRFLVLERDSKSGSDARIKRIYVADTSRATDVSSIDSLTNRVPKRAIEKRPLIDLLHPEYGLGGEDAPEKPEGLAWGPVLPDGRRLLVVCYDNDFDPKRESILAAFAVSGL